MTPHQPPLLERLVVELGLVLSLELAWGQLVGYAIRARGWDQVGLGLLALTAGVMGGVGLTLRNHYKAPRR